MKRQKINGWKKVLAGALLVGMVGMTACGAEETANMAQNGTLGTQEEQAGSDVSKETQETGTEETRNVAETSPVETESVETEPIETEPVETEPIETEPVVLEPDVTAPTLEGVKNLTVEVGSNISYKKDVTVNDDRGSCTLEIDTSEVDLNTIGTYEVVYKATDEAGNETAQTIVVTVVNAPEVTEEEIYQLADAVIASVITEGMTDYEKAQVLWDWCHYQIKYSYSAGDRGLLAGAYEGLHDKRGDCYAYYATYEVLLTRVGIPNMCVTRIGGNTNHWWNLVNVGDGWYHCDTSPRKLGHKYRCFMQTDAQVAAYSDIYYELVPDHPNYFTFESELYPERATEIIVESSMP